VNRFTVKIAAAAIFAAATLAPASWVFAQAVCTQTSRYVRPIPLGLSGGNIASFQKGKICFSGTLGSLVYDSKGTEYILSNNHVLANVNNGVRGQLILQPGLIDTACIQGPGNRVATFSASNQIKFKPAAENTIDAAIAKVIPGNVDANGYIQNIGSISNSIVDCSQSGSSPLCLGLAVQKMGRTTCLTTGTITAIEANVTVAYDLQNGLVKNANFQDQIQVNGPSGGSAFAGPGDSGSLVVTSESCPRAVGLLFAGDVASGDFFLNPISPVLNKFNVQMVGGPNFGSCSTSDSTPLPMSPDDAASAIGVSAAAVGSARTVRDSHSVDLMKIPGANGTAIIAGDQPGSAAIEVYVTEITAAAQAAVPASLGGVQVKLVKAGPFVAF